MRSAQATATAASDARTMRRHLPAGMSGVLDLRPLRRRTSLLRRRDVAAGLIGRAFGILHPHFRQKRYTIGDSAPQAGQTFDFGAGG